MLDLYCSQSDGSTNALRSRAKMIESQINLCENYFNAAEAESIIIIIFNSATATT